MSLAIAAIGTAVPKHVSNQDLALAMAREMCSETDDHDKKLRVIYGRSGIQKRYSVLHELSATLLAVEDSVNGKRIGHRNVSENGNGNGSQNANGGGNGGGNDDIRNDFYVPTRGSGDRGPTTRSRMERYEAEIIPLATRAADAALEQAAIPAGALTHLVTVSCTGFNAPGFDVGLIKRLGLPPSIQRTHVGYMGCHGALNGLRVARSFLEADQDAAVLLCAAELCSLHLYYGWHVERMVANALFADGAAAIVGLPGERAATDAWRVIDNASLVLDDTEDKMTWRVGDHGFEMTLSAGVPDVIVEKLRPWLTGWLARHQLSIETIGSWAIHPGGPKIVWSVAEAAGLDAAAIAPSQSILADYGNMSSPTVLFILQRLQAANAPRPCVAIGFGPGLTIEAALIE